MTRAKTSSTTRLYSLSRGETSELRLGWEKKKARRQGWIVRFKIVLITLVF